jgi:tRNA threonylcarbamoyladenosine biosynthesis protein TsaE
MAVMTDIHLPDLAATEALAARLAAVARAEDAILLHGPLGAGKSALARAFLRAASGNPGLEVPSPTYTLAQTYQTRLGPVHHLDLWRLEGEEGVLELGWDEFVRDIVLVEWPERLGRLRPGGALDISIRIDEGESRLATLSGWEDRL